MKTIPQNLKKIGVIAGLFLGAFAVSAFAAGWTPAPCSNPASCNTAAPLNVGGLDQSKAGRMAIGKSFAPTAGYALDVFGYGAFTGMLVSGGSALMGDVGIGTNAPTKRLEVVGGPIKATGGLIIETVVSNPSNPETGRMWLITAAP